MRSLMNLLGVGLLVVGIIAVVYFVANYNNQDNVREIDVTHDIETRNIEVPAVERNINITPPATRSTPNTPTPAEETESIETGNE